MRFISHDCNFKDIDQLIFSFDFLCCHEKVHGNKEHSCENSNPCHESQITIHYVETYLLSYRKPQKEMLEISF